MARSESPATTPPEISWAAAARLLADHGLGELRAIQPLSGGWINRVALLNDDLVLRVRPAGKGGDAFLTEAALFTRLRDRLPVPEVLVVDTSRRSVDADVMLARRCPGRPLADAWLDAAPAGRERLMAVYAEAMRAIHAERFPACGGFVAGELQPAASWAAFLAARFERRLARVRACRGADLGLLEAIGSAWKRAAPDLGGETPCLIHRDLHFGNLLAGEGRITAVLDFEAAVSGPVEYELDQLLRFLRYPQLFLDPSRHRPTAADFADALPRLRRCYPELFASPNLDARLALYSLEYDLAALRDCYTGRWGRAAHQHVLRRIDRALERRVLEPLSGS